MSRVFISASDETLCGYIALARHRLVLVAPGVNALAARAYRWVAANRHRHLRAAVCHDVTSARLTRLFRRDAQGQREVIVALLQKCAGQRFRHMDATLRITGETVWTYSPAVTAAEVALEAMKAAERESGAATQAIIPQLDLAT